MWISKAAAPATAGKHLALLLKKNKDMPLFFCGKRGVSYGGTVMADRYFFGE